MFTFYLIGVMVVLTFLLSFLAWSLANKEAELSNIFSILINTLMLSAFSWIIIFVIALGYLLNKIKKSKKEE